MIMYSFFKTLVVSEFFFGNQNILLLQISSSYVKAIFPILYRYGKKNQIVTKIKYTNIIFQFTKHRL